ncbi:MAG: tryptophan-rich sensory protein [Saprospiraceae bacterium]|nr:tryptophan-rich sensory protein [Saprospiraceae bacterium]
MNQYSPVHIRLALINLLGLTGVLVVNTFANTLPINGITTGELSAEYPNLFVPAGITFAIWGVIYLALVGFSVYSVTMAFQKGAAAKGRTDFLGVIGPWFFISCLANMTWIIAWHHRMIWISVFLMLILLTSLIAIYTRLYIGRVVRPAEKIWVHLPFSIYLGWITVATVANITALLVHLGWSGAPLSESTLGSHPHRSRSCPGDADGSVATGFRLRAGHYLVACGYQPQSTCIGFLALGSGSPDGYSGYRHGPDQYGDDRDQTAGVKAGGKEGNCGIVELRNCVIAELRDCVIAELRDY